jgi:hypothetical protein
MIDAILPSLFINSRTVAMPIHDIEMDLRVAWPFWYGILTILSS